MENGAMEPILATALSAITALTATITARIFAAGEGTSGFDFAVYGVAGTTVAILLYFCKTMWDEIKDLRRENSEMATIAIEKVTAVATQAGHQLAESAKTMEAATKMMHDMGGRPGVSPDQLAELTYLLRALRERLG